MYRVDTSTAVDVTVNGRALRRRLVCPNAKEHMGNRMCEEGGAEDVFCVKVPGDQECFGLDDSFVLVYADGRCTNRYEDGTAGVPRQIADEAEQLAADIDGATCPCCDATAEWRNFDPKTGNPA